MMRKYFFLVLFLALLHPALDFFFPKPFALDYANSNSAFHSTKYTNFMLEEKSDLPILFFGKSSFQAAISNHELNKELKNSLPNLTSHFFSSDASDILTNYIILKEIIKTKKIKYLILEYHALYDPLWQKSVTNAVVINPFTNWQDLGGLSPQAKSHLIMRYLTVGLVMTLKRILPEQPDRRLFVNREFRELGHIWPFTIENYSPRAHSAPGFVVSSGDTSKVMIPRSEASHFYYIKQIMELCRSNNIKPVVLVSLDSNTSFRESQRTILDHWSKVGGTAITVERDVFHEDRSKSYFSFFRDPTHLNTEAAKIYSEWFIPSFVEYLKVEERK